MMIPTMYSIRQYSILLILMLSMIIGANLALLDVDFGECLIGENH